ncbi:MAG: beta-N-acetylhexosaminidase [Cyclobacteriaceae bacterium]|nr:beta-N-acetylhexosaminidase [Cyclobacteriaceae bacterium]
MLNLTFFNLIICFYSLSIFSVSSQPHINEAVLSHSIIPAPQQVVFLDAEALTIHQQLTITYDSSFNRAEQVIINALAKLDGLVLHIEKKPSGRQIQLLKNPSLALNEYTIEINKHGVLIEAKTARGAFYAAQTFRQILWSSKIDIEKQTITIPAIQIQDKPENKWRGFHTDVSRHFFTKEYLMTIIDRMALYKMNKFQLHLTDDQGWRIEIDKYPLLTKVGAYRTFNNQDSICMERAQTNPDYTIDSRFIEGSIYGGYYTKDDMREVITYAAQHFIDIIPEVDMPGHMSAAIRAYPYLSCTEEAGWGAEFSYPICPCKDEVLEFSFNIWDEIIELFPSDTVHIGADEVEKETWESSPLCQNFMKKNGMTHVNEIQNYYVKALQKYLEAKGKTVIAWDDVIEGQVNSNLLMMYWRDYQPDSPTRTAKNGNNIILTPWSWFYLSGQNSDSTFRAMYEYNIKKELDPIVLDKVLGYQACVWTETLPSEALYEYYVFPKFQGFAEVAWTSNRNWDSFKKRLKSHYTYMESEKINFRMPEFASD